MNRYDDVVQQAKIEGLRKPFATLVKSVHAHFANEASMLVPSVDPTLNPLARWLKNHTEKVMGYPASPLEQYEKAILVMLRTLVDLNGELHPQAVAVALQNNLEGVRELLLPSPPEDSLGAPFSPEEYKTLYVTLCDIWSSIELCSLAIGMEPEELARYFPVCITEDTPLTIPLHLLTRLQENIDAVETYFEEDPHTMDLIQRTRAMIAVKSATLDKK